MLGNARVRRKTERSSSNGAVAAPPCCEDGPLNWNVALSVQAHAEQGAEPLLGVEQVRQPDLRVHLLHILG